MNYLKQYIRLIRKAEARDQQKIGNLPTHGHHVFPKSIYGQNNRIVNLTYKEHLVAHHLLYMAMVKRYGALDQRTNKMASALSYMCNITHVYSQEINVSSVAKRIRESNFLTGENHPNYGMVYTEEQIKQRSKSQSGSNNTFYGRTHTPEAKRKISEASKGRRKDNNKYTWLNIKTGQVLENLTRLEFTKLVPGCSKGGLSHLINKRSKSHRGWTIIKYKSALK